jgi:hypothetical protein
LLGNRRAVVCTVRTDSECKGTEGLLCVRTESECKGTEGLLCVLHELHYSHRPLNMTITLHCATESVNGILNIRDTPRLEEAYLLDHTDGTTCGFYLPPPPQVARNYRGDWRDTLLNCKNYHRGG